MDLRRLAREIYLEALGSLDIRATVQRAVVKDHSGLHIGDACFDLNDFSDILIIAIGKAALPMTEGLLDALQLTPTTVRGLHGIVVGSTLPAHADNRLLYRLGSHPLPDANSEEAATLVLRLLATATERTLIFFLLSGGASAMVELPLTPLSFADLASFHQLLVHSGLSIAEMNTFRKHLSAVKGGRLATAAPSATQCTLLVSDVPPSHPEVIGSGPSLPDPTTLADCRHLLATRLVQAAPAIRSFFHDANAPETPKPDHPGFNRATHCTLLSSDDLALAAGASARARGFRTSIDQAPDEWHFVEAATYLLKQLQDLARTHPHEPLCLISTGEVAVPITASHPGTGGRNQHFALHCASSIATSPHSLALLSAGSDGADGNSPAAGAVIDNTTLSRAARCGLEPAQALARFNSYPFFQSLGDAILTGPTGNNLRDLRLLLLSPARTRQS